MAKKSDMGITERIRREVVRQGITGYRLSVETGISETACYRFISGETGLRSDSLDKVCKLLGMELVPVDELRELRKLKRAKG